MYNNINQLRLIKMVQKLTRQHYEPGRYDRCYAWVYKHKVNPVYPMSYKTFLKYISVKLKDE